MQKKNSKCESTRGWQHFVAVVLALSSQGTWAKELMGLMQAYEAARSYDPVFKGAQPVPTR